MTTKISVTEVQVSMLQANTWNTNIVTPENEERIKASLERFGMFRPVIARQIDGTENFEILGGEHRWQVATSLGYKTIPVINLGYIDDRKAKEISLVDNGRYGEDDTLLLADLLKDLGDTDEIMSFMPYTDMELANIFAASDIALDELDIEDDTDAALPALSTQPQTHQVMRFKIPMQDSEFIQKMIDSTMKSQGFTEEDSLANAGNAVVHLLRSIK